MNLFAIGARTSRLNGSEELDLSSWKPGCQSATAIWSAPMRLHPEWPDQTWRRLPWTSMIATAPIANSGNRSGCRNLTALLSERDAYRAQQQQARQRAEQQVTGRLAARELARQQIRPRLDTMAATTLDQISDLDSTRSKEAANRLVQTAELAPETFAPDIIEHLFSLADSEEYWLIEPSLATLASTIARGKGDTLQ
jgi:hypothetical protein